MAPHRERRPGVSVWQRSFYDHVIRDEKDLNNIREYIVNNPLKWELNHENPKRKPTTGFSGLASYLCFSTKIHGGRRHLKSKPVPTKNLVLNEKVPSSSPTACLYGILFAQRRGSSNYARGFQPDIPLAGGKPAAALSLRIHHHDTTRRARPNRNDPGLRF